MEDVYNNNSLAENKVLILYTLNRIDREITDTDLFKIISANSITSSSTVHFLVSTLSASSKP